jgi:hypothetical protein
VFISNGIFMNLSKLLSCSSHSSLLSTVTQCRQKSQFKYLRYSAITIFTLSLAACGGGGADTPVSAPEASVNVPLSSTAPILLQKETVVLPGEQCATGGIELASAVDLNNDGFLDASEIDTSEIVCDGKDGLDGITALVAQNVVAPGDSCENGGLRFDVGLDIDDNGVLDASEVDSTEFLCTVVVDTAGFEAPSVVSAISISNTEIMLQFSEPMLESDISNGLNYNITNVETDTHIPVWDALIANEDNSTVLLTTSSQSSVRYLITVVNVRDVDGNSITKPTIAAPSILSNPSSTTFVGTDPSGNAIADSDGDTLPDHTELSGWDITINYGNGTTEHRRVTSDPGDPNQPIDSAVNIAARDTDSDGVTDNEERHGGIDPRQPDTDGDTLTDNEEWNIIFSDPSHQDTDGDGTQDGFEFYSYRTSPVLADTDGDQISDTDEILARNRDPRIADIPRAGIDVGEVRLFIDERYTFEDVQGETVSVESSSNSTLTQSENRSFATSNQDVTEHVVGGSTKFGGSGEVETEVGVSVKPVSSKVKLSQSFEVAASYQYTNSNTFSSSQASQSSSQSEHQKSLNKAQEFNATSTVTREVFGASIDVDLTIRNDGDMAFSISNLEITVLKADRQSTGRFLPVATLIANSNLITGNEAVFNLGPFTPERGPILFSSRDIFPALVDQLMASPDGLIFKVANFDMTDEFGRVFSFANQEARDRTAGVIIDFGGGQPLQNLVATALQPDVNDLIQPDDGSQDNGFVGGFNGDGSPKGIPLDFALQDILAMTKNATIPDGIIAGLDRVAQSIAVGDDVQLVPSGTTGVRVGTVVVSAGADGVLDSSAKLGDVAMVTTGYQTSTLYCDASTTYVGNLCSTDADCRDATSDGACSVTGPEALMRVNGFRNGDLNRQWAVLSNQNIPAGADFGKIILKPGADIYLAFVQDLDEDGLFAREEYLLGSTDSSASFFNNSEFGANFDPASAALPADDIPDSKDSDRDGLGDFAEARIGWNILTDGGRLRQVFSSPRLRDSDGDGLQDSEELDIRNFCDQNLIDAVIVEGGDHETALSYGALPWCAEIHRPAVDKANAVAVFAGLDGTADSTALGDDRQLIPVGVTGLTFSSVIIDAGPDGNIDTNNTGDDVFVSADALLRTPPSTNPAAADTDADGISDGEELKGFFAIPRIVAWNQLGVTTGDIVTVDTQAVGDDIQHRPVGQVLCVFSQGCVGVVEQAIVILPGPNGIIDSIVTGTDLLVEASFLTTTDPLNSDTDGDQISDGREVALGANPNDISDGQEFIDSDQDGISDAEEQRGWLVTVDNGISTRVSSNPNLTDSDLDGLPDLIERDIGSHPFKTDTDGDGLTDFDEFAAFEQYDGFEQRFAGFSVNGSDSRQFGTNPFLSDTDGDGLSDRQELLTGYRILVPGENAFQVYTNPLESDTDFDGLTDFQEVGISDATNPDTDDDGVLDGIELRDGTDLLVPDMLVTFRYEQLRFKGAPQFAINAQWNFNVATSGNFPGTSVSTEQTWADGRGGPFGFQFGNPKPLEAPFSAIELHQCAEKRNFLAIPNQSTIGGLGQFSFPLRKGETFTLNGALQSIGACPITVQCRLDFFEPHSFETLNNDGSITNKLDLTASVDGCAAEIFYTISTDRR